MVVELLLVAVAVVELLLVAVDTRKSTHSAVHRYTNYPCEYKKPTKLSPHKTFSTRSTQTWCPSQRCLR